MQQALHIFRKDFRHLWPRMVILMVLVAANAVLDVRSMMVMIPEGANRIHTISDYLTFALTVSICFAVAGLIFEEGLSDDRQFWLTRPYAWTKLLGTKVLFLLVFLNLPLLLSDCYILGSQGLAVLSVIPRLLLRQLVLTTLFILPSFAIATVTAGFAQFVLAWLILPVAVFVEFTIDTFLVHENGLSGVSLVSGWSVVPVIAVTTCGVILWQYARRTPAPARIVLLIVAVAFLPTAFGFSRLMSFDIRKQPRGSSLGVQVFYDSARPASSAAGARSQPNGYVVARIPLGVEGLPANTLLRGNANLAINVDGTRLLPGTGGFLVTPVVRIENQYWLEINVLKSEIAAIERGSAELQATFALEVVTDQVEDRISLGGPSFVIPHVGRCYELQFPASTEVVCCAGLEPGIETSLRLDRPGNRSQTVADLPAPSVSWGLSPTPFLGAGNIPDAPGGAELAIIPRHHVASFERTIDVKNVELRRYVATQ